MERLIKARNTSEIEIERYFEFFQSAPDGCLVTSPEGVIREVNVAAEVLLGERGNLLGGKSLDLFVAERDLEAFRVQLDRASNTEKVQDWEVCIHPVKGDPFHSSVSVACLHLTSSEETVLLWLIRDISGRKRDLESLRKSQQYFRSLLFDMHEDILVIDRDFLIKDANKEFIATIGRRRAEVIGHHCYRISHGYEEPCNRHGEDCMLQEVFETGQPRTSRHEHINADGSKVWVDILFSPLKDEEGKATHVIEAIRDVTQEVELRRQLRQAQKMESIGTLAGGIAHDFNNILMAVMGFAEMALADISHEKSVRKDLDQVLKAANRAKELVKQILAFSRQTEQERKPLRVDPIIKEAVRFLRASLPSTIEIRQYMDANLGAILADPTQIHQVLINLCSNAAHSMRETGGTLEIRLMNIELSPAEAARQPGMNPGPHLLLVVSDAGHGMDHVTMERIFEPYFTTKGQGEGTGLGLAVVHGIVKSHHGCVTVQSKQGKGTSFRILFPRLEVEAKAKPEPTVSDIPTGKEHILFVDDEEALAQWGKIALEGLGYKVTAKTSSIEALEIFRAQREVIDVVITDFTMPGLTGMELARKLMLMRPDIPVVLCTGFSEMITEENARAMGIREFIMKPLSKRDLAEAIRKILATK